MSIMKVVVMIVICAAFGVGLWAMQAHEDMYAVEKELGELQEQ